MIYNCRFDLCCFCYYYYDLNILWMWLIIKYNGFVWKLNEMNREDVYWSWYICCGCNSLIIKLRVRDFVLDWNEFYVFYLLVLILRGE